LTQISLCSEDASFWELYAFKRTSFLIPPTKLLIINLVGVVASISDAVNNGYQSGGPYLESFSLHFGLLCTYTPVWKDDGSAKSNPNNCDSVVNHSHIHILTSMGAHWSIFGKG
jgi:hypothetical protein